MSEFLSQLVFGRAKAAGVTVEPGEGDVVVGTLKDKAYDLAVDHPYLTGAAGGLGLGALATMLAAKRNKKEAQEFPSVSDVIPEQFLANHPFAAPSEAAQAAAAAVQATPMDPHSYIKQLQGQLADKANDTDTEKLVEGLRGYGEKVKDMAMKPSVTPWLIGGGAGLGTLGLGSMMLNRGKKNKN